jgi:hypothetical protein
MKALWGSLPGCGGLPARLRGFTYSGPWRPGRPPQAGGLPHIFGRAALAMAALAFSASCGYHISGHADALPTTVKTSAVPAFTNATTRYKLTDRMPEAIAREFITRTRYRVVPREDQADAILRGAVLNYLVAPTIFDQTTGRAATVELHVTLQINLVERTTGKVLFSRPSFEVRERYQISTDPARYFEESDPALARASQQVARQVVSAILENF